MMQSDDQAPRTINPATSEDSERTLDQAKDLLRAAAQIMHEQRISELDLSVEGIKISLRAGMSTGTHVAANPGESAVAPTAAASDSEDVDEYVITAPMIGTFYAAPAPGEEPYVQPGDSVEEGQTIGIIEAMKIMNEIAADRSGEVVEILAENGETVEFGSPLIRLKTV